jgi:hypothetical protein
MTVRDFDGIDDKIHFDPAAWTIDGTEQITFAALWRADVLAAQGLIWATGESVNVNPFNGVLWATFGGSATGTHAYGEDEWMLTFLTVPAGTSGRQVRSHVYNYETAEWTHADHGEVAGSAQTIPADSLFVGRYDGQAQFLNGNLAMMAVWAGTMPWAVDDTGDATIEAAGLTNDPQAWVNAGPTHLWRFDQADTAEPVTDSMGGAHQTQLDGTTVLTGDDPPAPWTFDPPGRTDFWEWLWAMEREGVL